MSKSFARLVILTMAIKAHGILGFEKIELRQCITLIIVSGNR